MKYLSVAIENSVVGMDILYTYSCYDDTVKVGDCVKIPFGAGNRKRKGFVFEVNDSTEYEPGKIKPVAEVEKSVMSPEAVHLCSFLKERYLCRYIDAVKCFIPRGYFMYEDVLSVDDEEKAAEFCANPKSPKRQAQLINLLLQYGTLKKSTIKNQFGIDYAVMTAVCKKGLAVPQKKEKKRRPHSGLIPVKESFVNLTKEQAEAFSRIKSAIDAREHKVFLIHGVTGSGKTRLYMEAVRECVSRGRGAIILVPEISLTVQAIERFRGEFGAENIAVIHSKLSDGEKYDEWMRIKRKEVKIILGARSALFAPLEDVGVIVVDEEHESSYKADNSPKYDTRELAEERARYNDGILIMGSATPSVTTYYRSEIGEIEKLTLNNRYNDNKLPKVHIVDMREELRKGNKNIFSIKLYEEIERCLKNRKQVILFLNRRGYSSFISCRSCGFVLKCPECGVSMTYHKSERAALCHYCGRKEKIPQICPECGSKYIKDFGIGTERVEELVKKIFPQAVCDRLDLDTVRRKGSAERILSDFRQKKTDILIGTQLVAKGLDFQDVDVVGIIAADISLNIADYRAAERTFQLITQAAGRAGRGEEQGRVIVQTYSPEHYSITAAAAHDYRAFYDQEIMLRKALSYPPFGDIIQVVFLDEKREKAEECAKTFCSMAEKYLGKDTENQILGYRQSHIIKIGGRYRYAVLIKYKEKEISKCLEELEDIRLRLTTGSFKTTSVGIDINPYSFV